MLGKGLVVSFKGPTADVPAQPATAPESDEGSSASGAEGLPTWQLCLQGPPEAFDECCAVGRHKATLLEPPGMMATIIELYTEHQLPALSICSLQKGTRTFGEWARCRATE